MSLLGDQGAAAHDANSLLATALDVGSLNLKVLSMLDAGHTGN